MSNVILSTAYLPSVEYFAYLTVCDGSFIESAESYTRQSSRNRCLIYGPNGLQRLSVPVMHPERTMKEIRSVRIDHSTSWQNIHLRSIATAYNKSPFFLHFRDEFEKLMGKKESFLFDFNYTLLTLCLKCLKSDKVPLLTTAFQKEVTEMIDLRERPKSKIGMPEIVFPRYPQVFEPVHGFIPNLSIIDLLFNRGNDAQSYLKGIVPQVI